jgi:NAD+ kinase
MLTVELIGGPVDLVTADLSFISLTLVLPALTAVCAPGADLVLMVKPQFEVGKERLGRGGVVREPELRSEAVLSVARAAGALGWGTGGVEASPLPGPSGNVEYFLWLRRDAGPVTREMVDEAVAQGPTGEKVGPVTELHQPHEKTRRVLVVAHTGREAASRVASDFCCRLLSAGVSVRLLEEEAPLLAPAAIAGAQVVPPDEEAAHGVELVVVFGGDGSILRGAELARPAGVPLLGVNLGHVGFLAEADRDQMDVTVERVVRRDYEVEERLTVDVDVLADGALEFQTWALNEASVEKASRQRLLEAVVEVDGRPVSRFGCDGVVFATPTGSTAYNFSAGGPIVWPEVQALLMVPISAHALFARPMVVSPESVLAVEVLARLGEPAVLWCDGRRTHALQPGARVEVRRGKRPVLLARMDGGLVRRPAGAQVRATGQRLARHGREAQRGRGCRPEADTRGTDRVA